MQFIHSDLGQCKRGDVAEITLTRGANVRLLDSANFSRYRRGQQHRCIGGLARKSPVRLAIPNSGHWHVAVDMQGLRGSTRAGIRLLPAESLRPLPPLRQGRPELAELAHAIAEVTDDDAREFDVFISHASEDKDAVVRPLAAALSARGLSVWFDEFELRIGDSLRRKIDVGIARSRFGIVVLSPQFFAKSWPQYELDGLVTMANSGRQVLLPLWHGVSRDDVIAQSPSLADKVALHTADLTIDEISDEIASVIGPQSADPDAA
ncbi:MAG: DUF1883 domain-containing protein [Actinomycetota bacterium]|nr:DUF1883 domain-containing protein [Actinomycetota bacterium]